VNPSQQYAIAEAKRHLARARKRPLPVSLDRELEEPELLDLATAIAERPELWQHLRRHDPDQRVYGRVFHNEDVEAWLICWMDGHDTGFHDHDVSRGALAVVEGEVREDRLVIGGPPATKLLGIGQTTTFGAADIHRVTHAGARPSVTVHVYSPPIRQMGAYEFVPGGTLKRHPKSTGEELKPLNEPADVPAPA
jgi:predicted metal-dependent enzyme (double-stranded beta helix superfamily)